MNFKRTALLFVVVGALAVWLRAAAISDRRDATRAAVARPVPIDASSVELAREIAQLHDRLRPGVPPNFGRDLFQFGRAGRARNVVPQPSVAAPGPNEGLAPSALQPALKLIGVAEDPTTDGLVRTAIISGPGQLFLVKEGDHVTPRYVVGRISPDVVELIDAIDGSARRLALD